MPEWLLSHTRADSPWSARIGAPAAATVSLSKKGFLNWLREIPALICRNFEGTVRYV